MASVILQQAKTLDTMVDLLRQQAARFGDRTAYVYLGDGLGVDGGQEEKSISFRQLDFEAKAIASKLQQELSPGDRALLVYPAGLDFISAFFGCLYAGVVAVPATYPKPRRPLPRMASIARDSGAKVALTTQLTLDKIDMSQQDDFVAAMQWMATDIIPATNANEWSSQTIDSDQLAFLQYTSGSTSDPKGVMVSHGNLLANLEAIRQSFGLDVDASGKEQIPTGVFWLPAYHDMGLIGGILTPLFVGGRSLLMAPTAFLQKPMRWLQAIDDNRATISGAPNFAYEYCVQRTTPEQRAGLDFSNWQLAFCGAEPIRVETIRQFTEAFASSQFRPDAFYPCYGLAESTLLAAGAEHRREPTFLRVDRVALAEGQVKVVLNGSPNRHVQELVGCGSATAEHRVEVMHPITGAMSPEGVVGEIVIQGPSVAQGYWKHGDEANRGFHTQVHGLEGEFLATGDLGFFYEGELFVTGRLKDVIIIRGRNHYPQDIEHSAEGAHTALMAGAAFSVPVADEERLVVVNQIDRHLDKSEYSNVVNQIRQEIAEQHELDTYAVVLIRQKSLSVTSSGKVQRSLTRDQFLAGELRVVHEWKAPVRPNRKAKPKANSTGAERNGSTTGASPLAGEAFSVEQAAERIEGWLEEWLVERVGLDPADIHRDKPFAEFGVDSLTAVELSAELEEEFGVPLPPIVAWNYPTPAALSRYLAEQSVGGAQPAPAETDEAPADDDIEDLLAEIEGLSDEEAERLLGE